MEAAILATERLAKRFGGVVAADQVSLAVAAGEFRCIIGPNGAGKSTLFALLGGIYPPDQGRVLLKGIDVTADPAFRRVRRGLGLTFQTNRAYHALSIRQNLEIPLRPSGSAGADARNDRLSYALGRFDLDPADERPASLLPHHQLQWLEIAMALASGPDVLLLDEPTAGMSPDETLHTARVLQHLNGLGLTIIVIEHDIAFVREVARRVTVLHQGRVFAEGTMESITAHEDVRRIYLGRA
ncbi:MAG: ABC transporter ATP-binding protein [Alphaproteobacteria bacterium]|nr:ABC transporter ATP-binding protein [Alphaproteobacteria bacterium]